MQKNQEALTPRHLPKRVLEPLRPYIVGTWGVREGSVNLRGLRVRIHGFVCTWGWVVGGGCGCVDKALGRKDGVVVSTMPLSLWTCAPEWVWDRGGHAVL